MHINDTSCCAVQEIAELREYGSAKEAMLGFYNSNAGCVGTFYIFTGVIKSSERYDGPVDSYKYGPNFEAYIRKYRLGTVMRSPSRINKNNGIHTVVVWVWTPNERALERWYNKVIRREG